MKKQLGFTPHHFLSNIDKVGKKINPHTIFNKSDLNVRKSGAGFTLIELLVVIAIIGLLASVIMVSLISARIKSRDAKRVGDVSQLAKAMELYFNTYSSYPTTTNVAAGTLGVLTGTSATCVSGTPGCVNYFVPNFVIKLPTAPIPADPGCTGNYGGGKANDYQFVGTGAGVNTISTFGITFCLGNKTGQLDPGIHTVTNQGIQ